MAPQTRWRRLSEIRPVESYAGCLACGEVFIDDLCLFGSLMCPCGKGTLYRGMSLEQARAFRPYPHDHIVPPGMALCQCGRPKGRCTYKKAENPYA